VHCQAVNGLTSRLSQPYSTEWLSTFWLNRMPSDSLSTTLFALADPTRRGLLARLAAGDATVTELAEPYDMSLAAISKHLKVLETAGLISRGREAQWRPCHLEAEPLQAVSQWLEDFRRFWDRNLESLGDYLKTMQRTKPDRKPRSQRLRRRRRWE
jgi:DNA-binding transcriptional ArsR family regulator